MNRIKRMYVWSKIKSIWNKYCIVFIIGGIGIIILSLVSWIAEIEKRVGESDKEHMEFREIKELKKTVQGMVDERNALMKLTETPSPEQGGLQ